MPSGSRRSSPPPRPNSAPTSRITPRSTPPFAYLADFDELGAEAHERGLRVILDYVLNHTSELHPWFLASRSSKDDPRRDWYIWRDPAPGGGPPNDWQSEFPACGGACDFSAGRGQTP